MGIVRWLDGACLTVGYGHTAVLLELCAKPPYLQRHCLNKGSGSLRNAYASYSCKSVQSGKHGQHLWC